MPGIDPRRLALAAEQDTAADALDAVSGDQRLRAVVLLSARDGARCLEAVGRQHVPVFGLVSKEDRGGPAGNGRPYLAGDPEHQPAGGVRRSRPRHDDALTRQFEHPDAEPLEVMIADWLAARLA